MQAAQKVILGIEADIDALPPVDAGRTGRGLPRLPSSGSNSSMA